MSDLSRGIRTCILGSDYFLGDVYMSGHAPKTFSSFEIEFGRSREMASVVVFINPKMNNLYIEFADCYFTPLKINIHIFQFQIMVSVGAEGGVRPIYFFYRCRRPPRSQNCFISVISVLLPICFVSDFEDSISRLICLPCPKIYSAFAIFNVGLGTGSILLVS